jgi:hypothetical protein
VKPKELLVVQRGMWLAARLRMGGIADVDRRRRSTRTGADDPRRIVSFSRWRWLLMGSVCAAVPSCGGRASLGDEGSDDSASGGAGTRVRSTTQVSAGGTDADGEPSSVGAGGADSAVVPAGTGGAPHGGAGGATSLGGVGGASDTIADGPSPSLALVCEPWIRGGWERCNGGVLHRLEIAQCPSQLPRPFPLALRDEDAGPPMIECERDVDCTERAHGECVLSESSDTYCRYGCTRDDECAPGFACVCGHTIGRCQRARCRSDADCGDGLRCLGWDSPGCGGGYPLSCQTAEDECIGDADCGAGEVCGLGYYADRRRCRPVEACP